MAGEGRFTLTLTLRDRDGYQAPISMAINVDEALRMSTRAVDELKLGFGSMDEAVKLMRQRDMRKDVFKQLATLLGTQMAERMEDAEGWHDSSRIEPAREALGGSWKD